ncbi:hypothetical protein Cgig2_021477 [Carnegiea gigantea]|uniref:Uncharacterized protein n=1 Tax=Carnegiea gigantea TaxID=171969 RepID=A0A9Q1GVT1_9CARY|nr:hypothetical protein Cgig2_021477 [Carnegiea gigantea]
MYPADKDFDKRVCKHVAKHFKQYKHGLKRDYFKPEEKTREDMYGLFPKGTLLMGGCDWLTIGVQNNMRKRGYTFPDNNMELKRVKEELASQKAMSLLMLKAVHNGKITNEFLDATEAALRMAGDQVPEQSSGNDLSKESRHTGPLTSASQVN